MMLKTKLFLLSQTRQYSSKAKSQLTEVFNSLLENNELKCRKHPGIIKKSTIGLPEPILNAMKIILEDYQNKSDLYKECIHFKNQLNGRHLPLEENNIKELYSKTREKLLNRTNVDKLTLNEIDMLKKKNEPTVSRMVKQKVNHWQPIIYNKHKSLLYMLGRSLQDYAVLNSIFKEIQARDEKFKPQTVLDFGSGVGSTMWAINDVWPKKVNEFVNVDVSNEMNDLSGKIMNILYPKFTGAFHRLFMPMSLRPNYDVTVSAYSLIELPNVKSRLDVVMKLWNKTKNYLVIVEQGTDAGFKIVNEARDFILHLSNASGEKDKSEETHVFAPCPHDFSCPKRNEDLKPCVFEARYNSLSLLGNSPTKHELYSYVVLKKGEKSGDDCNWPRIISPTLKKGGHVICRTCTSSGKLEETIFTRSKHGRNLYRCARVSKWGHRIPMEFKIENDTDSDSEKNEKNTENVEESVENFDEKNSENAKENVEDNTENFEKNTEHFEENTANAKENTVNVEENTVNLEENNNENIEENSKTNKVTKE